MVCKKYPFIYLAIQQYLLSAHYVPGTVLGAADIGINKKDYLNEDMQP